LDADLPTSIPETRVSAGRVAGISYLTRRSKEASVSTAKQKRAARQNIKKAQAANRKGSSGHSQCMSTAEKNDLDTSEFAFPKERKEPLCDAKHVRNAIARFDQVEDVSDGERDEAWKRIKRAAKNYDVEVSESSWRELMRH
jgi:hypothetical protein